MSIDKIKLLQKCAEFEHDTQKHKIEAFSNAFNQAFRAILNEMEGDVASLKYTGFNSILLKEFKEFYYNLIKLYKKNSIEKALDLVSFIKDHKPWINNISKLIKAHLESSVSNFISGQNIKLPQVDSLNKVLKLSDGIENFIRNNPLLRNI